MKEIVGNIWDFHKQGYWVVVTTNGVVKSNGEAVMGKGIALEAKERFPGLARDLGRAIVSGGSKLWIWPEYRLITFPTKGNWRSKARPLLIERSCQELVGWLDATAGFFTKVLKVRLDEERAKIYLPRPGCGNGGLDWKDIKPILEKYLDDRFIVVERSNT